MAEKYLSLLGIEIVAFVGSVGHVSLTPCLGFTPGMEEEAWLNSWKNWWQLLQSVQRSHVDQHLVRCPDLQVADQMQQVILFLYKKSVLNKQNKIKILLEELLFV